ncbi:MAG TPA: outer membrane protein assembly factor BamB [Burkholderiaceae bacterium]|nr:outer membrane protein assembly factor BamB [Burkholderiaceae bacterium]
MRIIRMRALLAMLGMAALLGGCGSLPSWMPSWLGGSSSKSAEPAPLVEFAPSLTPRVAWRTSVGSARRAVLQPAVLENAIYAAAGNGTVVRIGPTGEIIWRVDTNTPITGAVGSDGFVVAVGSPRGDVIALGADGKELWRAQVGAAIQSPPLVGRGLVVVRGSDYSVSAFEATSGRRRWNYQRTVPPLTLSAPSEMSFAGDFVAVGYPSGRLVMLAVANGTVRWDAPVAEPRGATEVERLVDVLGAPRVIGGEVCAAAYQGRIACFEVGNGNLRWAREFSAGAGLGADTSRVYGVDAKSHVAAFANSTGANAWRQEKLLNRDLTTPLALRRAVLVGDYAGYLHFLSPEDGGFLARVPLGSEINATPQAFGGGAIVQTQDGTVALVTVE